MDGEIQWVFSSPSPASHSQAAAGLSPVSPRTLQRVDIVPIHIAQSDQSAVQNPSQVQASISADFVYLRPSQKAAECAGSSSKISNSVYDVRESFTRDVLFGFEDNERSGKTVRLFPCHVFFLKCEFPRFFAERRIDGIGNLVGASAMSARNGAASESAVRNLGGQARRAHDTSRRPGRLGGDPSRSGPRERQERTTMQDGHSRRSAAPAPPQPRQARLHRGPRQCTTRRMARVCFGRSARHRRRRSPHRNGEISPCRDILRVLFRSAGGSTASPAPSASSATARRRRRRTGRRRRASGSRRSSRVAANIFVVTIIIIVIIIDNSNSNSNNNNNNNNDNYNNNKIIITISIDKILTINNNVHNNKNKISPKTPPKSVTSSTAAPLPPPPSRRAAAAPFASFRPPAPRSQNSRRCATLLRAGSGCKQRLHAVDTLFTRC